MNLTRVHKLLWAFLLLFVNPALADSLLERIRASDLNDYALGVTVSTSPATYKGADDSTFLYPYLTSVKELDLTDDWFVVGEGDVGFRFVRGDWTFGAVGRVQTLGFDESDELRGIDQRKWALEVAPTVSYRKFPVKIKFKPYFELSDRHDGVTSQLEFSYPMQGSKGYLTPAIEFTHQSEDYTEYYYGVSNAEAGNQIPAYQADKATNTSLKLSWGYYFADNWILIGRAAWTSLDDEIADSPLVDDDNQWLINVGVAYNADFFRSSHEVENRASDGFSFKFTALESRVNTEYRRDAADGTPGTKVDIEDLLGLSDKETVYQFDGVYRFFDYHRFEVSYTEMSRDGARTIARDFTWNDREFIAGTDVLTSTDTKTLRFSYGFSLIRDTQKELGISIGVHQTQMETEILLTGTGESEFSDPDPVLPTFGAYGMIALGEKTQLVADVNFYGMDMDRYDGSMTFARVGLLYKLGAVSLGAGYSYYAMNLDSTDDEHVGRLDFTHQGPTLSVTFDL